MAQTEIPRRIDCDEDWATIAAEYQIRPGTTYLNHGSFGISPRAVLENRRQWTEQLDRQPMDFYVRRMEEAIDTAISRLAEFVGTTAADMVFAENATFGMNVVADSLPLRAGEEVLLNNHEYGAVHRIWQRACQKSAAQAVIAQLPDRFESPQQIVDTIFAHVTGKTRLIVISHITSPTALIMPVSEICQRAQQHEIPVCIDGPHAIAQLPLNLDQLGCMFYTASCHKWLCGPLGSGFLYVHPKMQPFVQPQLKSWGRLLPAIPEKWNEEFIWSGTRNPATYLSLPAAIGFLESVGLEEFRQRTHWMAQQTQNRLIELTGKQPIASDFDTWYGTMAHVPLPSGDWTQLQSDLWNNHQIEVPIIHFEDQWFVRVSHHLYNTQVHIEKLLSALKRAIGGP